ncbi:MAG TPA: CoA transferase [Dehalococcoidia bacterium]|nr:CoA transferase [Dehalococcoidia bacterium]
MGKLALEGIRVIELCQYWAGPSVGRFLVPMGAEVIKIESKRRPDGARGMPPHVDGIRGLNRGCMFYELNPGKLSVTLDLGRPEAIALVKQLVGISDIITQNFTPGVLAKLGLDYPVLRSVKEDIIMLSVTGFGTTGPDKDHPAFGDTILGFTGIPNFTGYPGGPPEWIGTVILDPLAGLHGVVAVLAALEHRAKTGQGQYIDLAMTETGICCLPQAVMDFTMNRHVYPRMANRDNLMAPQGVYRCQGDDKWVAISIATDEEWQAFCRASKHEDWLQDERFSDAFRRWQNHDELDRLIGQWTINYTHYEVMHLLQRAGVAAGPVFDFQEMVADPHIRERGLFVHMSQPETGEMLATSLPFKMDGVAEELQHAPEIGEHNEYVLGELLGLSKEKMAELQERGVIY